MKGFGKVFPIVMAGLLSLSAVSAVAGSPGQDVLGQVDLSSVPELPNSGALDFSVLRDGSEIGFHKVSFTRTGDEVRMQVMTRVQVSILGITVFSYEHDSAEVWQKGHIVSLSSRSNDNGDINSLDVEAVATEELKIISNGKESKGPLDAVPSSLWYLGSLQGASHKPLLHTIHGALLPLRILELDRDAASAAVLPFVETALIVEGADEFYRELWYDQAGLLIEARVTADDGSEVRFIRPPL